MSDTLRALYVCYLSLEDPLVHTQVVAYLEGLARRGHEIHLLTFDGRLTPEQRRALEADLGRRGIHWHSLRYHKRPSLPATVFDVLVGAAAAARLVRRHQLDAIHARNHVPGAIALLVRRLTGCQLIFDIRGLMAEEYVDAGHWRAGGVAYRITNWVQRRAIQRADGVVTLTEALKRHLFDGRPPRAKHEVIPCCVDLHRLDRDPDVGVTARRELGIGDRPVMIYIGKFTGWYMEREMVEFFAVARQCYPNLLFLVLTQSDPSPVQAELDRCEIPRSDYLISRAEPHDVGRYLAAGDFGVSFVRPCFSKISSSPTKVAEYLAAGLPTVSTAIGDLDTLFADGTAGVIVQDFSSPALEEAAHKMRALSDDPDSAGRCRALAEEQLSLQDVGIPRYDALYREVARR